MQYANSWMCWSLQSLQTAWCCRNLSLYLDVQRCEWRSWSNKSSWILVDSASVVVEVRSLSKFKIVCSSFHAAAIEQIRNENKPPKRSSACSTASAEGSIPCKSVRGSTKFWWMFRSPWSEFSRSTSWVFPTFHSAFCIAHILWNSSHWWNIKHHIRVDQPHRFAEEMHAPMARVLLCIRNANIRKWGKWT